MTYISVKEAAEIAGKNERTIRRWIKAGKIAFDSIKGKYHIKLAGLEEYLGKKTKNSELKSQNVRDTYNKESISSKDKSNSDRQNSQSGRIKEKNDAEAEKKKKIYDLNGYGEIFGRTDGQAEKMSGHIGINSSKYVQVPIVEYDKLLQRNSQPKDTNKNNVISEGKEYFIIPDSKKMSDYSFPSMSVNKKLKSPIISQEPFFSPVDMSVDSDNKMSVFGKSTIGAVSKDNNDIYMSEFDGHLSTKSDMPVDNYFGGHDIIGVENPFFESMSDNSGKMSGHNNRTINLSAYAVRLIDEKERVVKRFEEQNDFLKSELSELRKEISALRDIVGSEKENQANLSQILLARYEKLEDRLAENMEMRIKDYQQQLQAVKIDDIDDPERAGNGFSNPIFLIGFWIFILGICLGLALVVGIMLQNLSVF